MRNIVVNMFEKFHDDRSRNDRALGDRKSDNNNPKNKQNNNNNNNNNNVGGPKNDCYMLTLLSK